MNKWTWEIMTDRAGQDICDRLEAVEKEGWTVVAICETDAGSGYYKVFMRRDTHPFRSYAMSDPRQLWSPEHRKIDDQRCSGCGVRPGDLHLKNCPTLKESK